MAAYLRNGKTQTSTIAELLARRSRGGRRAGRRAIASRAESGSARASASGGSGPSSALGGPFQTRSNQSIEISSVARSTGSAAGAAPGSGAPPRSARRSASNPGRPRCRTRRSARVAGRSARRPRRDRRRVVVDPLDLDSLVTGGERDAFDVGREGDPVNAQHRLPGADHAAVRSTGVRRIVGASAPTGISARRAANIRYPPTGGLALAPSKPAGRADRSARRQRPHRRPRAERGPCSPPRRRDRRPGTSSASTSSQPPGFSAAPRPARRPRSKADRDRNGCGMIARS